MLPLGLSEWFAASPVIVPTIVDSALRFLALTSWHRDELFALIFLTGVSVGFCAGALSAVLLLRSHLLRGVSPASDVAGQVSVNGHQSSPVTVHGAEPVKSKFNVVVSPLQIDVGSLSKVIVGDSKTSKQIKVSNWHPNSSVI